MLLRRLEETTMDLKAEGKIDAVDGVGNFMGTDATQYLKRLKALTEVEDVAKLKEANFFYSNSEFSDFVSDDRRDRNVFAYVFMSSLVHELYVGYEARNVGRTTDPRRRQAHLNRMNYHLMMAKIMDDKLIHDGIRYVPPKSRRHGEEYRLTTRDFANLKRERRAFDELGQHISKIYKA